MREVLRERERKREGDNVRACTGGGRELRVGVTVYEDRALEIHAFV